MDETKKRPQTAVLAFMEDLKKQQRNDQIDLTKEESP